jgi:hypothetical protein
MCRSLMSCCNGPKSGIPAPRRTGIPNLRSVSFFCQDALTPTRHGRCTDYAVAWECLFWSYNMREGFVTPDEELKYLNAELERLKSEHPGTPGVLRMTDQCLRRCSKWKWEQHGWTISEGQTSGIMNGSDQERRTALLSVLKGQVDQVLSSYLAWTC